MSYLMYLRSLCLIVMQATQLFFMPGVHTCGLCLSCRQCKHGVV